MKKVMATIIVLISVILTPLVQRIANAEDNISLAQKGFGVDCGYRTMKEIGEKSFYETRIEILPNFKNGNEMGLNGDFYLFLTNNQEMEILSVEKGDNWWSEDIYIKKGTTWTHLIVKMNGKWNPALNPIKNPAWCEGTILFKIWYIPLVKTPVVKYRTTLLPGITFTRQWDTKIPDNDLKKLAPSTQTSTANAKISIVWGSIKTR